MAVDDANEETAHETTQDQPIDETVDDATQDQSIHDDELMDHEDQLADETSNARENDTYKELMNEFLMDPNQSPSVRDYIMNEAASQVQLSPSTSTAMTSTTSVASTLAPDQAVQSQPSTSSAVPVASTIAPDQPHPSTSSAPMTSTASPSASPVQPRWGVLSVPKKDRQYKLLQKKKAEDEAKAVAAMRWKRNFVKPEDVSFLERMYLIITTYLYV